MNAHETPASGPVRRPEYRGNITQHKEYGNSKFPDTITAKRVKKNEKAC
jgi:hypothetical protein